MLKAIIRLLISAILVMFISYFLKGITIAGFGSAIIVALVLALLNLFVKPLLHLFTFPLTVMTLGLFSLVVNALIVFLCDYIVGGFDVDGFLTAILFSLILSLGQSIAFLFVKD